MIVVKHLAKQFKPPRRWLRPAPDPVHAVSDVSFTAPDGHILGLLGPNGAGKTTSLRMLDTLMRPDAGQVLVDGIDAAGRISV